jgi:DMSO/TMAO reductase YedYZ molybdopterin-dependent catalytic subunit
MSEVNRRRFLRYGILGAIVAGLGIVTYLLLGRPAQRSEAAGKLPPGQYEVRTLNVLDLNGPPQINLNEWTFEVAGEVETPVKLNWSQFLQLPKTNDVSEFDCVTGWTRLENRWEGVRFREIANLAHPTAKAKYATVECYGSPTYTTSLPLDYLLRDDVLFAYGLDGEQLAPEHGGPLRLVVPGKYGYKSAKWVKRVRFTETRELGFWESYGYSDTADPWTNDRYG